MEDNYVPPFVEILDVEVEKGFLGSIPSYDDEDFNWN